MKEEFLYYIWKHTYFKTTVLRTASGKRLTVVDTGVQNHDAGPDFLQARLRIGGVLWAGAVEMHSKTSDWYAHRHERDKRYDQVILHVVWEQNGPAIVQAGVEIETLELKKVVDPQLVDGYQYLKTFSSQFIACERLVGRVPTIYRQSHLTRKLIERLSHKSKAVRQDLQHQYTWEDAATRSLIRNFGFQKNKVGFDTLARAVPLRLFDKYAGDSQKIYAILFGLAGFLSSSSTRQPIDTYRDSLLHEFQFLAHKHQLVPIEGASLVWTFHRTRPANFPTLRLAQLGAILSNKTSIVYLLRKHANRSIWQTYFKQTVPSYWANHYRFGATTEQAFRPEIGQAAMDLLLINVVAPLAYAYAQQQPGQDHEAYALQLLASVAPETNQIVAGYRNLGFEAKQAADTQALLEMYHSDCSQLNCLSCGIGHQLIRKGSASEAREQQLAYANDLSTYY